MADLLGQKTRLKLAMGFLKRRCAEGDQILGSVIVQSAPRLNVMDVASGIGFRGGSRRRVDFIA
jgi:hypothetical protein